LFTLYLFSYHFVDQRKKFDIPIILILKAKNRIKNTTCNSSGIEQRQNKRSCAREWISVLLMICIAYIYNSMTVKNSQKRERRI